MSGSAAKIRQSGVFSSIKSFPDASRTSFNEQLSELGGHEQARGSSRRFVDWLLSPSLYPSEERVLSKRLEIVRLKGFRGSVYRLRTDRSIYSFFCPNEGILKPWWPRLKQQILGLRSRGPSRLAGIRFMRTIGELPVWLEDSAILPKLSLQLPRNAEILCVIERRVAHTTEFEQLLEDGIGRKELALLVEFIGNLPPVKVRAVNSKPIITSLPSGPLQYLLELRERFFGLEARILSRAESNLTLNYYTDGVSGFELSGSVSREELIAELGFRYSLDRELLALLPPGMVDERILALVSYQQSISGTPDSARLRWGVGRLHHFQGAPVAVITSGYSDQMVGELAELINGDLVEERHIDSSKIRLRNSVIALEGEDVVLSLELIRELTSSGFRVLTVSPCGGLVEVPLGLNPEAQAIQAVRGISALLKGAHLSYEA
jgi:hypothetical protein